MRFRLMWLAFGIGMLALCLVDGHTVYQGLATGCIKAKYGYHCEATAPVRYAITTALTTFAGLGLAAGTVLALVLAFTRKR